MTLRRASSWGDLKGRFFLSSCCNFGVVMGQSVRFVHLYIVYMSSICKSSPALTVFLGGLDGRGCQCIARQGNLWACEERISNGPPSWPRWDDDFALPPGMMRSPHPQVWPIYQTPPAV